MQRIMYVLTLSALGLNACKKNDAAKETVDCIKEKIQLFVRENDCETTSRTIGATVKEYRFQNRLVYVFSPGNCSPDFPANVLDENCQSIGSLGGFAGSITVNGESFEKAEFKRTIWEK